MNDITEAELAELQDPDTWDWDSAERGAPHAQASAVVRVRLRGADFWAVAAAARAAGQTLASFLGQAAVERPPGDGGEKMRRRQGAGRSRRGRDG
jgi:hypothetical protein